MNTVKPTDKQGYWGLFNDGNIDYMTLPVAYRECSLNIYIPMSGISEFNNLLSVDVPD
jgi:hypothetical protein